MKRTTHTVNTARIGAAFYSVLLLTLGVAQAASASTVVTPNAFAATPGGTGYLMPNFSGFNRYQQVFASSEFGALSRPELITSIAIRQLGTNTSPVSSSFSNVLISLSTTPDSPDALSTTFAANQGSDLTIVHNGPLTFSGGSHSGVQPFDISFGLTAPFLYNPAAGNLLLDVQYISGETQDIWSADGVFAAGDSVSRIFAQGANAATGSADTFGWVAEFNASPAPVPVPAAVWLLGSAIGGLGFVRRRFF